METHPIDGHLSLAELDHILNNSIPVTLSENARQRVQRCYDWMHRLLENNSKAYYGINTGFGALCNTVIPASQLQELQRNLVLSHACGAGNTLPDPIVKGMLFLKALGLSRGYSGVATSTVQLLLEFHNRGIYPVVYDTGSLGASGDLAPLAHVSLALIGEGYVSYNGTIRPSAEVLTECGLQPLVLQAKEGLALLNGTQFMTGVGTHILLRARKLWFAAHAVAALAAEGYDCRPEPFDAMIHTLRPHAGQQKSAALMRSLLEGSELIFSGAKDVQDPYSFRCIPQVHGGSWDAILHACNVFETEINSVTDNPLVVPEEEKVISGGNFHGQTLAITLDHLAIAISEMGSISERRIYRMISGKRNLPPCLIENAGLNSGFMILQYAAAALASKNKQLCTPASADSIESSLGQEDHVSMGANAAVQCLQVLENTERILGMELFAAYQAVKLRSGRASSPRVKAVMERAEAAGISKIEQDVLMQPIQDKAAEVVRNLHTLWNHEAIWSN